MRLEQPDIARLWDILEAARFALEDTRGMTYGEFLKNRTTRQAVERNLEIIGEAARQLTQHCRESIPGVPWRSMIGLRNILAHEYGDVRYEVLWHIVTVQLGTLMDTIEATGADQPPQDSDL